MGEQRTAEEKKQLRREMLARRDRMEPAMADALNRRLWEQMERCQQLWSGMPVYSYISYRCEADTRRLVRELWKRGIPVAAPRAKDGRMEFYRIRSESDLTAGYRGIPEPVCGCEKASKERALVIVPGAVFDLQGYRIGYGGGYYDRFMAREPGHETLGLAYDFQVIPRLPVEEYDLPVGRILTTSGLVKCGSGPEIDLKR